jgi:hypothetical protein
MFLLRLCSLQHSGITYITICSYACVFNLRQQARQRLIAASEKHSVDFSSIKGEFADGPLLPLHSVAIVGGDSGSGDTNSAHQTAFPFGRSAMVSHTFTPIAPPSRPLGDSSRRFPSPTPPMFHASTSAAAASMLHSGALFHSPTVCAQTAPLPAFASLSLPHTAASNHHQWSLPSHGAHASSVEDDCVEIG